MCYLAKWLNVDKKTAKAQDAAGGGPPTYALNALPKHCRSRRAMSQPSIDENPANDEHKMATEDAARLPTEMLNFVLRQGELAKAGLRLGQLTIPGRAAIATPNFVASTSRGVIPHVTQDVQAQLMRVPAVYVGLEDCTCIIACPRYADVA